jgi:regulator of protease activity HflC (stomatin/prohibitin superfamily)
MVYIAIVLLILAVGAIIVGRKIKLFGVVIGGVVALLVAVGLIIGSSVYSQGRGEAKVLINPGGTVGASDSTPGFSFKSPFQTSIDFDTFSQSLTYAGNGEGGPSYTGGDVQGQQVTVPLKGGVQAQVDVAVIYSIDATKVGSIVENYSGQETFTKRVVEKQILASIREVGGAYEPADFRAKKGEVSQAILDLANGKLNAEGVTVDQVTVQDDRLPEAIQAGLDAEATAQQNARTETQNLETAKITAQQKVVTAEADAEAAIKAAQGQAEANREIAASLTPEVLEAKRIEALKAGTVFVVPEGSQPLVNTAPAGQ